MRDAEEPNPFVMVGVGPSAGARKFVELESFAADLVEAADALDLALGSYEPNSPLEDARRHLVASSAMAYGRAFTHSKVRGRLTDHVEVPADFVDVHDQVRAYRNATVAHSQSELATTYPVGVLEADSLKVRAVVGATVLVPVPRELLSRFRSLIDVLLELLDGVSAPVSGELGASLEAKTSLEPSMLDRPVVTEAWEEAFDARTKRTAQPRGHRVYWEPRS